MKKTSSWQFARERTLTMTTNAVVVLTCPACGTKQSLCVNKHYTKGIVECEHCDLQFPIAVSLVVTAAITYYTMSVLSREEQVK